MSERGVAAVDRALSILSAFTEGEVALTLAALAERTGLYKSTLLRLAASLERAGYLRRLDDGRFTLGPALLQLGELYQASFNLADYVMPTLHSLVARTGESASLYVREDKVRICLFRVNSLAHRVLHYVTPGTQLSLHTGAAGRILVAYTEADQEAKANREKPLLHVSATDRKSETAAIASPVFSAMQGFVGALSVAGPKNRFTDEAVSAMSDILLQEAENLTRALGGVWPQPSQD